MSDEIATLTQRALDLVSGATERGTELRLVGSLACRLHCPGHVEDLEVLRRGLPQDLDFVAAGTGFSEVKATFEADGFVMDEQIALASARQQLFFRHSSDGLGADVYMGTLNYCHPIDFKGRLACDSPTIPLAELLLAKLQIVDITEKDVKDGAVLLLEHELAAGSDDDVIDAGRVATILADDWGFHHTTQINLHKLESAVDHFSVLGDDERLCVRERIGELRAFIGRAPKSRRWRLRSRVGTRVRWYQPVEDKPETTSAGA